MHLSMLLDMAAEGFADRVVLGPADSGPTAGRLRELADAGAASIGDADALIHLAVNGPALPVALFAAARAGVPLIPLNYRLGADQLATLLAHHPRALVIAGPDHDEAPRRAGLRVTTPQEWLDAPPAPAPPGQGDLDSSAAPVLPGQGGPDSPAVLIYTSGTTSTPKAVVLRHRNLVSYVLGTVEFAAAGPEEAALVSVPPYHIAAVAGVLTNLYAGRRALTLERFTADGWLRLVREQGITHAMVVPTMLARIMDAEGLDRSVPALRALSYGGARMPARVVEAALRAWPDVDFAGAYGLTETSSTITVLGPREHRTALDADDPAVRSRLGSAGLPVPGVELEVRDASGTVLGAGEKGEIWVRGEQVSGEYAGQGAATDERGFFPTRDRGHLDGGGYLHIEGRADDTIIRGAENIAPAEIEDVLLRHPDVLDAVVVGVPDDEWGQRIEAVVVLRAGAAADGDGLRDAVRAVLRGSRTPDRIVCWPELPRTATGKLVRREIVEALAGEGEAR
ncbi:long-chain fatty acid--CoA ligase [Streptomyces sp. NPDC004539]|uniref:class I adenylate-forming enzyme family protein n=1 Tax=Streptomyces sp. NPDC004539 TaxID=3154280 RepID=UPI0033AB69DA